MPRLTALTFEAIKPDRIPVVDETGREVGHAELTGPLAQLTITDAATADLLKRNRSPVSLSYSVRLEALPVLQAMPRYVPVWGRDGEPLGYREAPPADDSDRTRG